MNSINLRFLTILVLFFVAIVVVSAQPASPLGKSGSAYFHYVGTIGKIPVTMDLTQETARYDNGYDAGMYIFSGSYFYNRLESPLQLYGYMDEKKNLILAERNGYDDTGSFSGKIAADGQFKGMWMSADSTRKLPFTLRESYPEGSVAFELTAMVDSVKLKPGMEGSPQATYSQTWLAPRKVKDATLAKFIENEVRKGMIGDSLAAMYKDPKTAFKALKDSYFTAYKEEVDFDMEPGEDVASMGMWSYEESTEGIVAYNQNNLLTIGYMGYAYLGGAHGMYGTTFANYDLKNRKRIELKDVLKPGYENKILPLLERAVRRQFNLQPDQALSEVLFEDKMALTDNFGLTGKGIFFNYMPYEIAAYAAGEIRVFVSFSELKDLLQPAFLLK